MEHRDLKFLGFGAILFLISLFSLGRELTKNNLFSGEGMFSSNINDVQTLTVDLQVLSCPGLIQVSVDGGLAPYQYVWEVKDQNGNWLFFVDSDGYSYTGIDDPGTDQVNSRIIRGAAPGLYQITITDSNGLPYKQSDIIITPPVTLAAKIEFQGLVCVEELNSGLLLLEFINGFSDYDWKLSKEGNVVKTGVVSGSNYLVVEDLGLGDYILDWVDANDCKGTTNISIKSPDEPVELTLNVRKNVSCPEGNDGEVELNFSGGWVLINPSDTDTRKYMFELYKSGILVKQWANSTASNVIVNLSAGEYQIKYSDRVNQNNVRRPFSLFSFDTESFVSCTKSKSFTITEPDSFNLDLSHSIVVCQGDTNGSIILRPTGGTPVYEISFYSGHFDNQINPIVDPTKMTLIGETRTGVISGQQVIQDGLSAGQFAVLLTDANGCNFASNVTIIENPKGQVNDTDDIEYCSGDIVSIPFTTTNPSDGTTYTWVNSNPSIGLGEN